MLNKSTLVIVSTLTVSSLLSIFIVGLLVGWYLGDGWETNASRIQLDIMRGLTVSGIVLLWLLGCLTICRRL